MRTLARWLLLLLIVPAFGEEVPRSPIQVQPFLAGSYSLRWEGKTFGTAWGLDPVLSARLEAVPGAKPLLGSYAAKLFWGNGLALGGTLLFFSTVSLRLPDDFAFDPALTSAGLQTGTGATALSGLLLRNSGLDDLLSAVALYNALVPPDPLAELRIAADRDWFRLTLRYEGEAFQAWGPGFDVPSVLERYQPAQPLLDRAWAKSAPAPALFVGGGVALGLCPLVFWSSQAGSGPNRPLYGAASWTLALGGLAALVAAPWLLSSASEDVQEAAELYNASL